MVEINYKDSRLELAKKVEQFAKKIDNKGAKNNQKASIWSKKSAGRSASSRIKSETINNIEGALSSKVHGPPITNPVIPPNLASQIKKKISPKEGQSSFSTKNAATAAALLSPKYWDKKIEESEQAD